MGEIGVSENMKHPSKKKGDACGGERNSDTDNPYTILRDIKLKNVKRIIIGQLNINSIRNKFEQLKTIVDHNIDILVITETKIDNSFPTNQFTIEGYGIPFRLDRNTNGGGLLIFVKEHIPCRILSSHNENNNFEGIFFEINLRKKKWLIVGGYNPKKEDIGHFLNKLTTNLNHYLDKYDNLILLGDFNSQMNEPDMEEFCKLYNLSNLIKEPTCFKNPNNPSVIDLILTNRPNCFQGSMTIETGLSDFHRMTTTILKAFFHKQVPRLIKYRNYKGFNQGQFNHALRQQLNATEGAGTDYEKFEEAFMQQLNKHAPIKEKIIRANNAPFMNKKLSKVVMTRSRLRNKYTKNPTKENEINYKKHRNYCVNLFKREKKEYYNNINTKMITDNKKFWKTVKPLFFGKAKREQKNFAS